MNDNINKVYHIFFDKESNIVVMDWDGYATSEQFREGTETMLKILIENKARRVLADAKDMTIIGSDDQKWMETDFLPRAIQFGIKACAIVRPVSYFNKIAVESVSYKVDKEKLLINFFDTAIEAREWLQKLPYN